MCSAGNGSFKMKIKFFCTVTGRWLNTDFFSPKSQIYDKTKQISH